MIDSGSVGRWGVVLLLTAAPVMAGGGVRLEGGAGVPLTSPQSQYYSAGGQATGLFSWELASFFELEGAASYLLLPGTSALPIGLKSPGAMLFLGAGVRFKRPLPDAIVVPWVELLGGYVGTGPLARFGTQGAVGLGFRLGEGSTVLLGPAARASFILSAPEPSFTSFNAAFLSVGLQLEVLVGGASTPVPVAAPSTADQDQDGLTDNVDRCPSESGPLENKGCPDEDPDKDGVIGAKDRCPKQAGTAAANGCPDKDGDTLADAVDECPDKAGLPEAGGCPAYRTVRVTEKKIEIEQKIFFAFGKAEILSKSFELLDEVVVALLDHQRLCVRIEGHTDSKGKPAENLKLSDDRASSVRNYLVEHGIESQRLVSKGFGDTEPLDDNRTTEGREKNRRVEFVLTKCQGTAP